MCLTSESDNADGDITGDISITVTDSLDANVDPYGDFSTLDADTYTITYTVFDSSGNSATDTTTLTILAAGAAVYATDLFISEYIEGSIDNKAIEIYNGTGSTVDLNDYSVKLYTNGSSSPNTTLTWSEGTNLDHGEVYVIYNSSASSGISSKGDLTSGVANFNGDDAIELLKGSTIIDVFGVVGTDPGSSWPVGSDSTVNHTLVRNANVAGPTTTWDTNEWTAYDQDTFDYLGDHVMTDEGPEIT